MWLVPVRHTASKVLAQKRVASPRATEIQTLAMEVCEHDEVETPVGVADALLHSDGDRV
jgi:hypothetical protein